jgi:hypothetical protein
MTSLVAAMLVSLAKPAQVLDLLNQSKEPFFDLSANSVFTGKEKIKTFFNFLTSSVFTGMERELFFNFSANLVFTDKETEPFFDLTYQQT